MAQANWENKVLGGRYYISNLLGYGGMSSVYKAFDPNLKREVAVKIIYTHLSAQADFVERFEREAAAVAQLRHPNINQVYDFSREGDVYYIVLEYVPGETLRERLLWLNTQNLFMPLTDVKQIVVGIANAIDYAHGRGIIHCDIKPSNIMLNADNHPVLMDFGITKLLGGSKHTATGITVGTVEYMSPEQIMGLAVDSRTDIYALGITMYEMLGGRTHWEAKSTIELMMMYIQALPPDLRNIRQNVPVEFLAVLDKAIAKNPSRRYDRAADMGSEVKSYQTLKDL